MAYMPTDPNQLAVTGVAGLFGFTAGQLIGMGVLVALLGGVLVAVCNVKWKFRLIDTRFDPESGAKRTSFSVNGKPIIVYRRIVDKFRRNR